ncbi:MAG TPA: putative lipid II flippase FtsW [Ktedonobacteraceae bacterium]|nr:putative lipid II flippase FtsW [Ktedonobacteraceae bacterium]
MAFGSDKQSKKDSTRGTRTPAQRGRAPLTVRSPALESLERQQRGSRPAGRAKGRMRYAAEETLARPTMPRKALPRSQGRITGAVQARPQAASAGARLSSLFKAAPPAAPVQVMSEEEQQKIAALEMRLPRLPGKIDSWLLVTVLSLVCIGLVMVYSASSFEAALYYGDASYIFERQLMGVVLGVVVMLVTMRIDYRIWRRFSLPGMIVTLILLVIVLKFGRSVYGASRWLAFGSFFSFQPSELAKLALALYMADWLARKGNQVRSFWYGLAPFVILVGIVVGLVLLENDLGTAIIIAGIATVMFFTAGANIVQFLLAMLCGGIIFLTEAFHGYRYFRLIGFLNPFKYVTSINLQLYQSLLALGSGGLLGVGLGASRQKTGYLPLPYIDSIFAIIGEELGFIGCALIILLFLFLAFRGFRLARRSQDIYGALLATGITTWLVLQAVINIGATTASIPYTGVPLPFISFGGSSVIVALAAVGVLLNISRYIQEPADPALSRRTVTRAFRRKAPDPTSMQVRKNV